MRTIAELQEIIKVAETYEVTVEEVLYLLEEEGFTLKEAAEIIEESEM